jgi:1,4-dihydroxy-2-naphthoate octaprenyltransferase
MTSVSQNADPTKPVQPDRQQLWQAAIKIPMYTVAVIPIWVGTAIAYFETRQFNGLNFGLFMGAAIAIIAWLNLSNDVFDSDTGIDVNKAHSVVNLTGNRTLVLWIANAFLVAGIGAIGAIALLQQDVTTIAIVLLCCFLGYTYQGPPFRLGYQGLGEVICWVCFGPLAIAAAYYSQAATVTLTSLIASVAIGITTSVILFCSHFHQVADDIAAGKRSPVVRLGTAQSAAALPWSCAIAAAAAFIPVLWGAFPPTVLLALVSAPIAVALCRHVLANHDRPTAVSNCKFIAVKWHFWSGLLFGIGFFLGPVLG